MATKYSMLISMLCLFCCTLKAEPVIYLYGANADKAYRLTNSNDFDQEMARSCPESPTVSKIPGLKFAASLFLSFGVCGDELNIDEQKFSELKNGLLEHLNREKYTLILLVDDYNQNLTDEAIENLKNTGRTKILKFNKSKQKWEVLTGSIAFDREAIRDITGEYYSGPVEVLVVGESKFHSKTINRNKNKWLTLIASSLDYIGCEIPEKQMEDVAKYAQNSYEYRNKLHLQMIDGLASFQTSMSFSSKKNSKISYNSEFVEYVTEFGKALKDELIGEIPVLKNFYSIVKKGEEIDKNIQKEKSRAKKAGASFEIGRWINEIRKEISKCSGGNCTVFSERFTKTVMRLTCSVPKGVQRDKVIRDMINYKFIEPDRLSFYTKQIYEKWISSHDSNIRKISNSLLTDKLNSLSLSNLTRPEPDEAAWSAPERNNGLIDITVDEISQKVMRIKIIAPGFGAKAESAMQNLPFRIRDYYVYKRVCVRRKANSTANSKRFCIVYNKNNTVLAEPLGANDKKIALRNIPSQYLNYKKFGDF